ncbi:MAG: hypothetical protein KBS93_10415 [Flavobacteriaceae bacterium]|nr:hypothetical protein [Candidatus Onthonaster equi]
MGVRQPIPQNIPSAISQEAVETPVRPAQVIPSPEPKRRTNKPMGSSSGSAFSLKSAIKDIKKDLVEEEVLRNDLPREKYELSDIQNFWNKFLERLKLEQNIPAYNALSTTTIYVEENNVITLEFISASSESEFETYKNRIINGLRNSIKNFYFTIEVKYSAQEAKSHILTSKQKFEALVLKNPVLLKLKEEFGLDLYE